MLDILLTFILGFVILMVLVCVGVVFYDVYKLIKMDLKLNYTLEDDDV